MQRAGSGIFRVMLVVTIYGNNAGSVGSVIQEPGKSGLQRSTLATVILVMQKMHLGVGGSSFKIMQILCCAAIIDKNNIGKTVLQQTVNNGQQLFVWI